MAMRRVLGVMAFLISEGSIDAGGGGEVDAREGDEFAVGHGLEGARNGVVLERCGDDVVALADEAFHGDVEGVGGVHGEDHAVVVGAADEVGELLADGVDHFFGTDGHAVPGAAGVGGFGVEKSDSCARRRRAAWARRSRRYQNKSRQTCVVSIDKFYLDGRQAEDSSPRAELSGMIRLVPGAVEHDGVADGGEAVAARGVGVRLLEVGGGQRFQAGDD